MRTPWEADDATWARIELLILPNPPSLRAGRCVGGHRGLQRHPLGPADRVPVERPAQGAVRQPHRSPTLPAANGVERRPIGLLGPGPGARTADLPPRPG